MRYKEAGPRMEKCLHYEAWFAIGRDVNAICNSPTNAARCAVEPSQSWTPVFWNCSILLSDVKERVNALRCPSLGLFGSLNSILLPEKL